MESAKSFSYHRVHATLLWLQAKPTKFCLHIRLFLFPSSRFVCTPLLRALALPWVRSFLTRFVLVGSFSVSLRLYDVHQTDIKQIAAYVMTVRCSLHVDLSALLLLTSRWPINTSLFDKASLFDTSFSIFVNQLCPLDLLWTIVAISALNSMDRLYYVFGRVGRSLRVLELSALSDFFPFFCFLIYPVMLCSWSHHSLSTRGVTRPAMECLGSKSKKRWEMLQVRLWEKATLCLLMLSYTPLAFTGPYDSSARNSCFMFHIHASDWIEKITLLLTKHPLNVWDSYVEFESKKVVTQ